MLHHTVTGSGPAVVLRPRRRRRRPDVGRHLGRPGRRPDRRGPRPAGLRRVARAARRRRRLEQLGRRPGPAGPPRHRRGRTVGASFGGRVATEVAATAPDRATRLVLLAPAAAGMERGAALQAFSDEEDALLEVGDVEGATEPTSAPGAWPDADDAARALVHDMQKRASRSSSPPTRTPNRRRSTPTRRGSPRRPPSSSAPTTSRLRRGGQTAPRHDPGRRAWWTWTGPGHLPTSSSGPQHRRARPARTGRAGQPLSPSATPPR